MSEEMTNLLIALIPSIVGVLGIIASVVSCVNKLRSISNGAEKENRELKEHLKTSLISNADLIVKYNEVVIRLDALHDDIKFHIESNEDCAKCLEAYKGVIASHEAEMESLKAELARVRAQLKALLKE